MDRKKATPTDTIPSPPLYHYPCRCRRTNKMSNHPEMSGPQGAQIYCGKRKAYFVHSYTAKRSAMYIHVCVCACVCLRDVMHVCVLSVCSEALKMLRKLYIIQSIPTGMDNARAYCIFQYFHFAALVICMTLTSTIQYAFYQYSGKNTHTYTHTTELSWHKYTPNIKFTSHSKRMRNTSRESREKKTVHVDIWTYVTQRCVQL